MEAAAASSDSMEARRGRVQRAFCELDKERAILSRITSQWKELEQAIADAEREISRRYDDLSSRERAFDARVKVMEESLNRRERSIADREQTLVSMFVDEKSRANSQGLVKVKQEDQLEHLDDQPQDEQQQDLQSQQQQQQQELAFSSSSLSQSMDLDLNVAQPTSEGGLLVTAEDTEDDFGKQPEPATTTTTTTTAGPAVTTTTIGQTPMDQVSVRPELRGFCESMDGNGLRKFIVEHRKEAAALRHELSPALQCALDPCRLVLDALEAYHPELAPAASASQYARKEPELSANRRACILILECLQVALADPVLGVDHPVVPPGVKEVAKDLAEKWRSRMDVRKDGSPLDAQAFLQLVATFGIASQYDEDELCKLVSSVARRKQTPTLCRALGLAGKIPEIVEKLIEEGKQIEALTFANEFGIMDRIQPVSLLKDYLKEARRVAQSMLKSGHKSAAALNDSMMKELSALRSVLKCIEDYNLDSDYPALPLQKRIQDLEQAKQDRKRTGGSVKGQSKRPRGSNNGGGYGYRNNNSDRNLDRSNHYGAATVSAFPFVSPVAFERQNQGGYVASYGPANPGNRTAIASLPPNSYIYSAGAADASIYGATYNAPPPTAGYASYATLRSALPPPPPAYQTSFMH